MICPNCNKKLTVSKVDGYLVKHCKNCNFLNKRRIAYCDSPCKQDVKIKVMCKVHNSRMHGRKCERFINSVMTRKKMDYDKKYREMEMWVRHYMGRINLYAV